MTTHLYIPGTQYFPRGGQSPILDFFLDSQKWVRDLSFCVAKKTSWRTLEHSPTRCWLQVGNKHRQTQGALLHRSSHLWTPSAKIQSTVQIVENRWPVPPAWRLFLSFADYRNTFPSLWFPTLCRPGFLTVRNNQPHVGQWEVFGLASLGY